MGIKTPSASLLVADNLRNVGISLFIALVFIAAAAYLYVNAEIDWVPAAVFSLVALAILFFVKYISLSFDKALNRLTVSERSILGSKSSHLPLDKIRKIGYSVQRSRGRNAGGITQLLIEFEPGAAPSPIQTYGSVVSGEGEARRVAGFLGVPFANLELGLQDLVSMAGQMADSIKEQMDAARREREK